MKRKKIFISFFIFMIISIMFSGLSFASSDIVVGLDPGHGGNDPGAMGGNLIESDLTWKIASRVKEILDATPGITGVLTKSQYEDLDRREERARRAVDNGADLLVSFHINSNASSNSMSGAEVYITHSTAERRFFEYSNELGMDILSNLRSVGVQSHSPKPLVRVGADWDKYDDGTIADYYGIISWPMHMGIPGILIEHAFINNPYDRTYYLNDDMLNKMAEADAQAIIANKELFRREYVGDINTDLQTMQVGQEADGRYYITGNVLIAEWIDGVADVPSELPEMTIKSTDGTFSTGVNLVHTGGLNYTYYRIIDNLDINKEYYLEATLTSDKNISTNKTQRVNMQNLTAGEFKGTTVRTKNNIMYFSVCEYVGDINTDLKEIRLENNQIEGNIYIAEYINNIANTPKKTPSVVLKSTDGSLTITATLEYEEGIAYNFSFALDELDLSKQYYMEVTLNGLDNIGTNKVQQVILPEKELGTFSGRTFITEDNLIKPTYNGEINTDLKTMNLALNESGREYISGEILIAEWINGVAYEPQGMPEMTIKSTDGTYSAGFHLVHNGGLSYNYDRVVYNLSPSKEYYVEVELTGENNIGSKKAQTVKLTDGTIGQVGDFKLVAEENKIKLEDGSYYRGDINTDLKTINVSLNEAGREYISGNILIAEWIDGVAYEPKGMPEMIIKSTDGTYSAGCYLRHEGGLSYYYDRVVYNLSPEKEYYIEVRLTNENNISSKKTQTVKLTNGTIGQVGDFKLVAEENKMKVEDGSYYKGDINTDLKTMRIGTNNISGEILIAEWIDSVAYEPQGLPKMTLKSTDGVYSKAVSLVHNAGLDYSYSVNIAGIDTNKTYYIEVELTGEKNIGTNKVQRANLNAGSQIGEYNGKTLAIENNTIIFKGQEYEGEINTDLKTMQIEGNKISGEILIAEWIDSVANEPSKLPEMTLKSEDETYSKEIKLTHEEGLSYSYEVEINDVDTSKEYYIEVRLTDENNVSTKTTQRANLNAESEVGIYGTTRLVLRDNRMIFEEIGTKMQTEEPKVEVQEEIIPEETSEVEKETENEIEEIPEVKEEKQEEQALDESLTENNTDVAGNTINIIN